jgi:hypothetical protein
MKKPDWRVGLLFLLLLASVLTYGFHYLVFRDLHHIMIYLIGDLAFMFINVLAVTLVFEELLARREKKARMKKLNMVIGSFFSDCGLDLLRRFPAFISNIAELAPRLEFAPRWQKKDFLGAREAARAFDYKVTVCPAGLRELRDFLVGHRSFLLALLENPNLLEHERFTDLLWAVFHVLEELEIRGGDLEGLPSADYAHLANDVKRAYSQIAGEWLAYAAHLKESYPFLYSLATRINPFVANPSPIVRG